MATTLGFAQAPICSECLEELQRIVCRFVEQGKHFSMADAWQDDPPTGKGTHRKNPVYNNVQMTQINLVL
eukprot:6430974-Amphidinium_carterae.1